MLPIIAVSSWALHHELGEPAFYGADRNTIPIETHHRGELSLLEMPAQLAARGIHVMEICHFHLPSREPDYLWELRAAMADAGVSLHTLLIDDGDLTSSETGARDFDWIKTWLPIAARLGAQKARVIAGKTAGGDSSETASQALLRLVKQAEVDGVQLMTENWFPLLNSPQDVLQLLDATQDRVELNLDFGNWSGEDKYEKLAAIAPRASSCHAKADFAPDGGLHAEDFARCLDLPYAEDFRGPFTLVAGGWAGVEISRDSVLRHFAAQD